MGGADCRKFRFGSEPEHAPRATPHAEMAITRLMVIPNLGDEASEPAQPGWMTARLEMAPDRHRPPEVWQP